MTEVCPGSNVYWYLGNRNTALNNAKAAGELTAFLMDTFFIKKAMAVSNMNGGGKKGCQKLNPTVLNAMQTEMFAWPLLEIFMYFHVCFYRSVSNYIPIFGFVKVFTYSLVGILTTILKDLIQDLT